MNRYIEILERDGLVCLENVITLNEIEEWKNSYISAWKEIKSNWNNLIWKSITYKKEHLYYVENKEDYEVHNLDFISIDLYDGKKYAIYKNTSIIDMGNGRYDFIYGFNNINPLLNNKLNTIIKSQLKFNYHCIVGGLPVENYNINIENINGKWHRDAYSLYKNEKIDLILPPMYFTILIPLEDIDIEHKNSIKTEFIIGSHKLNLIENNIKDTKILEQWINDNNELLVSPNLKVGDVCVFNGFTIHRGAGMIIKEQSERLMLYGVCKKTWLNDEPEDDFF